MVLPLNHHVIERSVDVKEDEFRQLIGRAENETLDFKEDGYAIQNPGGRGDFIKDLLAMANTPRERPAHIVFGVRWTPETGSNVVGLKQQLDDVALQDALGHNRVQPNPRFSYTPFEFKGKQVGVLEIFVEVDGPYTPTEDYIRLQAGAVYYRRGTQNARALSTDLRRIHNWFEGNKSSPEEQGATWRQLLEAVRDFDPATTYILAADRILPTDGAPIAALGMQPWRAVIDFDPESDISGFLHYIEGTLRGHRVIHRTTRGDYHVRPKPGTHWFFAQGLSGRQDTLVTGSHGAWLKAYKQELGKQLERVARVISPSPVVALVLWSDTDLRKHLRTLIEELHGAFGDAIDVVVVSSDEPSFSALSEEAGATFVGMNLRSLCGGLAVHYADRQNTTGKRCVLPTSSGAQIEVKSEDWLWLSEDLELIHRSIEIAGGDGDGPKEYRMGADISWRNLHLRHDCDRDITLEVRTQVEADLRRRQTVRINLYHEPGGGGTTVGRRLAWDLRNIYPVGILNKCAPRETAGRIGKISALTESSVLIIVDGGQHSERDIDDLYELLKANQTPAVLIQILRRFSRQRVGRRQFWLDATLTDQEADRFSEAYATAVSAKKKELALLAKQRNNQHRNAFFFGLTAYGQDYRGLRQYVADRTAELTDAQRHILVYIAMAHYYGQQSIPAQAFASFLKLPRSKTLDLTAAFTGPATVALGLLIQNQQAELRTTHHLVAQKIMQQLLAPPNSLNPEDVWHQNLSSWGKDFANFCHGDKQVTSDRFLELVRRVLIYRDNTEVLGTERAAQRQFAQLIDDIPSPHGRREIFRHLIDRFPLEAHFHAHFARFLSLNGEYDEALRYMDSAISLQPEDHVLHHMRGMVLRRRMRGSARAEESVEQLIKIAREASESFGEAREWGPDREHAYISEVQMLIDLVDQVGRRQQGPNKNVIRDVLTRSNADPFLQQALQKAEELLDRVQHLYAGEKPSTYAIECRAKLENIYGDYPTALQAWNNLLSRPEAAKPPVRRQIVWTTLRRHGGAWDQLTRTETARIQQLLEENLEEEAQDSTSLRLWLRTVRQLQSPPSLDSVIEKVSYWKANTGALDAAYYLYVLHTLLALDGSSQGAADAEQTLDECRNLARFRRDRTRSFEWIGPGDGVRGLVHQSRLGEWKEDFWESTNAITRCQGRIKDIGGPQKGKIEMESGIGAFFVPGRSGFHAGRDENSPVNFYLGFSYDGPRAWSVQRIET